MKRILTVIGTVVISFWSGTAPLYAVDLAGWKVIGNTGGIYEGLPYSLYNTDQGLYLQESDRMGANLGWMSGTNGYMKVQRITPGTGPLKCGEIFALFIEKEWVIYAEQTTGINLSTRTQVSSTEPYRWKFSCPAGTTVPLNSKVTLTHLKNGDVIVGCKRVWGVNLCWSRDVTTVAGKNYRTADFPGLKEKIDAGRTFVNALPSVLPRGVEDPSGKPPDEIPPAAELARWRQDKLEELLTPLGPPPDEAVGAQVAAQSVADPAPASDPPEMAEGEIQGRGVVRGGTAPMHPLSPGSAARFGRPLSYSCPEGSTLCGCRGVDDCKILEGTGKCSGTLECTFTGGQPECTCKRAAVMR